MVGSGRVGSGRVETMPSWAWPPGVGGRYVRTRLEAGLKKKGGLGPLQVTSTLIRLERGPRENQNVPLIPLEYVKRHTCHISTAVLYRLGILAVANVKGNGGKCAGRIVTRTLHKVGWCPWSSELPLRHVFKKGEQ
jgi:hypothetical protein